MPDPTTPDPTAPSDPLGTVLQQIVSLLPGLKKGVATTEFWGVVASVVIAFIGLFNPIGAAHLTPLIREYAVVIGTAAPVVYSVCRTVIKYLHGKTVVQVLHEVPNELLVALATQPAQVGQTVTGYESRFHQIETTLNTLLNDTKAVLPKRSARPSRVKAVTPATPPSPPATGDAGPAAAGDATAPWAASAPKG